MTAYSGPESADKQMNMFEVRYEHLPGGAEYNREKPTSL
jgi:hypothetical protein